MPLLMAKRALLAAHSGDCIKVMASDPGSWRDFHAFAQLAQEQLKAEKLGDCEFLYEFTKQNPN
jgi:TusA-related sulfurtransferase